ncbi:hypothetical protein Ahia01_000971300 [Argonauta hians]
MGKGRRQYVVIEDQKWKDIHKVSGEENNGLMIPNFFQPVDEIAVKDLDFDQLSDIHLITSFGERNVNNDDNSRTAYQVNFLCHGTDEKHIEAIEKEGLKGSKESSSSGYGDCYFVWWHVYPHSFIYRFPNDESLRESVREKREYLLTNVQNEKNRDALESMLINSAMFKVKLFPFGITHNFIASTKDIIEEYKSIMGCDKIEMKIYGTFIYLDPLKRTKYLKEVMYGIIVCPKGTERFSQLDNLKDDNDVFQYNAENPAGGGWKWTPYSSSVNSMDSQFRLWDFVGLAFYMPDSHRRLKPRNWKALPVPNKELFD